MAAAFPGTASGRASSKRRTSRASGHFSSAIAPATSSSSAGAAHYVGEVEVGRGEDLADTEGAEGFVVVLRDDAADDDGDGVAGAGGPQPFDHLPGEVEVGAGEDGEADDIGGLFDGALDDLLGREADAGVDDIEAAVAGRDGDHFGAVGVAIEAGLADDDPRAVAGAADELLGAAADLGDAVAVDVEALPLDAGGRAVLAEDAAEGIGPFAGGDAGEGALDRRLHQVRAAAGRGFEGFEGGLHPRRVALRFDGGERFEGAAGLGFIDLEDAAILAGEERRGEAVGPAVDADDDEFAGVDFADPLGHGADELGLQVAGFDGGADAAHGFDARDLLAGLPLELFDLRFDDDGAVEDVGVFEEVGFVSQDLLEAERPLLVPRAREREGLVPCGELEGAAARLAGEGDAEGFDEDAPGVVLGLLLREAERVDLDAVAEEPLLRVGHAVAVAGDFVPEFDEGAHLAHLFDEPDAGVHEEGDAADDLGEAVGRDDAALADGIEDADGVGEGEGELLHGSGAGFLQVVAADIRGVPLRQVIEAVLVHLRDEAEARLGREDVGAAGEVFLNDVVLGGALELADVLAAFAGDADVEGEQPHGGGVDGHRGVHLCEGDALEELVHIVDGVDRDADLADLGQGEGVVGGVAGLGGQVEGDGEAGLPGGEVLPVEGVGGGGAGVAGVGAEDPGAVFRRVAVGVVEAVGQALGGGLPGVVR